MRGRPVLLDGAQAIRTRRWTCGPSAADFYAFSGHKIYGPTGIGVLYGREELLAAMPPWQGGGDMILTVIVREDDLQRAAYKFEAGTPNISGAIGLGAAMDYVESLGVEAIAAHEHALLDAATRGAHGHPGLRLIGTAAAQGRRSSRSPWTASIRTTSAPYWIAKA